MVRLILGILIVTLATLYFLGATHAIVNQGVYVDYLELILGYGIVAVVEVFGVFLIGAGILARRTSKMLAHATSADSTSDKLHHAALAKQFKISQQRVTTVLEQHARRQQAQEKRAGDKNFPWCWPGFFFVGLWAWRHGIWSDCAGAIWRLKSTWAVATILSVLMVIAAFAEGSDPGIAVLVLLGISYLYAAGTFGHYGNEWLYIFKSDAPPRVSIGRVVMDIVLFLSMCILSAVCLPHILQNFDSMLNAFSEHERLGDYGMFPIVEHEGVIVRLGVLAGGLCVMFALLSAFRGPLGWGKRLFLLCMAMLFVPLIAIALSDAWFFEELVWFQKFLVLPGSVVLPAALLSWALLVPRILFGRGLVAMFISRLQRSSSQA